MMYILLLIILIAAQLAYFRLAIHYNIVDKPNERSSHKYHTLRGGGIIFYIGVLLFFIISKFEYPWFFLGLTFISIISFVDDVKQISPKLRIIIQFAGILLLFLQADFFTLPWYIIIVALIVCVGILNAFNFMDGINGITGIYSLVVIGALLYIDTFIVHYVDKHIIYVSILSLFVFNFFNFRTRAKCFAGDVGAVTIAFIILFLLGSLIFVTRDFSYIVLLAVYGVDTVLTIVHRIILKEHILEPHRKHLFQLLANEKKIPHLLVSTLYALLQLLIFVGLLIFRNHGTIYMIAVVIILSIVYIVVKRRIYHLH